MKKIEKITSRYIEHALLYGVKALIVADFKHKYFGPVDGKDLSNDLKERILKFQDSVYGGKYSYLRSERQNAIENDLSLDHRSFHFWAENRKGEIVGGLRLIPAPYEFSALTPELAMISEKYQNIFEISRYLTKRKHHLVAQLILFHAGSWIIRETPAIGMVALSKEKLKDHYKMYGIKDDDIEGPFSIDWRLENEKYYLVTADIRKIATAIIQRFVLKFKYGKK